MLHTRKGWVQLGPPTPKLVLVKVTLEFKHAVSVDKVKDATGSSIMKIGPAVAQEGKGHGVVASTLKT
jgi:hypothetical protein